ncbi:Predicted small integral membrane protein [Modicisalibacter ilicicola DSM 19980]|uniref:Predicted small integral membrane protein n=1 Tax=Modicisalibacter ilicicola DSM 19980 TaxID=1121942 RepID=A0A1M5BFF6_9GAMM|nr:DUF2160 domain-containing protein [Halomonas ilicicola]SHF41186.1 Predicted small integral membrane protein [Halomonas ilicicola DSM 19980]
MEWMAWTLPTALFFIVIGLILAGMTVWQTVSPGHQRKGFLPISTTRGDRLFISLLIAGYAHLLLLGLTGWPLWVATLASVTAAIVIMKWG